MFKKTLCIMKLIVINLQRFRQDSKASAILLMYNVLNEIIDTSLILKRDVKELNNKLKRLRGRLSNCNRFQKKSVNAHFLNVFECFKKINACQ